MKRVNTICSAVALVLMASSALAQGMPEKKVAFDLAAQPLPQALNAFAKQSKVRIVFEPQDAQGLMSERLKGSFTPQAALKMLLGNAGLRYEFVDDHTVEVRGARDTDTISSGSEKDSRSADLNKTSWVAGSGPIRLAQAESPSPRSGEGRGEDSSVPEDTKGVPLSKIEQVTVTGTHIRGVTSDINPVQVYDRGDIAKTGATTTGQFLKTIPQNYANVDGVSTIGAAPNADGNQNVTAGSAINFRGLGPSATLVLLDGNRVAAAGRDGSAVDISLIPIAAIERVEVLTDGSSAVYGADAVSGVVNFVLRDQFEGAEAQLKYGNSAEGGGIERGGSLSGGTSWGSGGIVGSYEYYEQDPIFETQRDFVRALPGTGGRNRLSPEQRRNSVFVSARQHLTDSLNLRGNLFYSKRDFQTGSSSEFLLTDTTGGADTGGATATLSLNLPNEWQTGVTAGYSRTNNDTALLGRFVRSPNAPPITSSLNLHTELSSLDWRADGPVFSLPADDARIALGLNARHEVYQDQSGAVSIGSDLSRNTLGGGIELFIPLIGPKNSTALAKKLDVSLAARIDHYDDFGTATSPKIGLAWSPLSGLNFRGSLAKSFRAPLLAQLTTAQPSFIPYPLPNTQDSNGTTYTIVDFSAGNPTLDSERSTSKSFGIDYNYASTWRLAASASYFTIDYENRVSRPPVTNIFALYSQLGALAPFLNNTPTPADIQRYYAGPGLSNPFNIAASSIEATFDNRLQNLASSRMEGIDGTIRFSSPIPFGEIGISGSATYLLRSSLQASAASTEVSQIGRVFLPARTRARAMVDWNYHQLSSLVALNYTSGSINTLVEPNGSVSSWTTVDMNVSYTSPQGSSDSMLSSLTLAFNVQNLTNETPPSVSFPAGRAFYGFDPTNASAVGRFYRIAISKKW